MVERLVGRLLEREQEIVRFRFSEDFTRSEIADRMGMSHMYVSRLLRRSFAETCEAVGVRSPA